MRFLRLELPAFGPFTDFTLDFPRDRPAFSLIYGPNEAGKSSMLRAIVALLYGVPARSGDAHVHDFARMRIAAELATASGEALYVARRKGLKHTLLDRDDKPLPEGLLAPLLGGLDESLFRQMFGLDHERLREGAEALLRGGGHVGEGLFDAGSGARAIRQALDALRAEADALYKPRGRTPKLNASVEQLREQRRKLRDAMLSPEVYAEQRRAVAEAEAAREALAERRRGLAAERAKLERQLALQPLLARHALLTSERAAHERALREQPARYHEVELETELQNLDRRLIALSAFQAEQPERVAELALLEREVAELRERLGGLAEAAGTLDSAARTRLRKLAEEERALLREQRERASQSVTERERLANLDVRLAAQAPDSEIQAALPGVLEQCEQRDVLGELARLELELTRESELLARGSAQLALSCGAAELARSALPGELALGEIEQRYHELTQGEQRASEDQKKLASAERELARRRAALLAPGALVTEAELANAQAEREREFQTLLSAWRAGEPYPGERVHAYQRSLARVDELALRMRHEARSYAELLRCDAERAELERERAAAEREQRALAERRAAFETSFRALTEALHLPQDLQPRELRARWLKLHELLARAERVALLTGERERLRELASEQVALLRALLEPAPGSVEQGALRATLSALPEPAPGSVEQGALRATLSSLLAHARARVEAARERERELRQLGERRAELRLTLAVQEAQQAALAEQLGGFRARSAHELARHGLAPLADEREPASVRSVDELLACLDELAALAHKQREIQARRAQLAHTAELEAGLRAELARVALACELEPGARSLREQLDALLEKQKRVREALRAREQCADGLRKLERELSERGEGSPLAELGAFVHELDPDAARAQKLELDAELESASEALRELDQRLGGLQAGLLRLEEPSSAVELAEQTESELASARALARRYLELELASSLLTREIERYRGEHQGPVLARASALFPRLTLGRYRALEVDYDERDEPVLTCVQKNGKRVFVAGLSDGTRDQLYLALRVASIERFLEHNPPLPLILDDAFVHFDDARAEAALSVLGELAQRTQVLFFTHHARMVELARRALGRQLDVHALGGDPLALSLDHGPLFA